MMISSKVLKESLKREKYSIIKKIIIITNLIPVGSIVIIFAIGLLLDLLNVKATGALAESMVGLLNIMMPIMSYLLGASVGVIVTSKIWTKI